MKKIILALVMAVSATAAMAARSPVTTIKVIRSYSNGDYYLIVNTTQPCGTDAYRIKFSDAGAKGMIATALTAAASGNSLQFDVGTCSGFGTPITSMFVTTG